MLNVSTLKMAAVSSPEDKLTVEKEGVIFVLKIEHITSASGHRRQNILEQEDLRTYCQNHAIDPHFCRKGKDSSVQMKFSCFPCRTVLESVCALRSHLKGAKHLSNEASPPLREADDFVLENGKWKLRKGIKRAPQAGDMSRRERVKRNKVLYYPL